MKRPYFLLCLLLAACSKTELPAETSAAPASEPITSVSETQSEAAPSDTTADTSEVTSADTSAEAAPAKSLSREELEAIARENISDEIVWCESGDFDNDGRNEMFVLSCSEEQKQMWNGDTAFDALYFINGSGECKKADTSQFGAMLFGAATLHDSGYGYFAFAETAGGSGSQGYLCGVRGNDFTLADKIDGIVCEEFHEGTDGRIYATTSVFYNGHQWYENLLEYDKATDSFTLSPNKGLQEIRSLAELTIENEDVWLNEIDRDIYANDARYCGYADLDNDHLPEFIVMTGHYGAHAAEGYIVYRFEGRKLVRYEVEDREYDDSDLSVWGNIRADEVFDPETHTILDSTCYPFPMYFVENRLSGEVRYIMPSIDGDASGTYYILDEYTFEDGVIRKVGSLTVKDERDMVFSFSTDEGEISREEYLAAYNAMFDKDVCTITNSISLGVFVNEKGSSNNADLAYTGLSHEEKAEMLTGAMEDRLTIDYDLWLHRYDCKYSSSGGDLAEKEPPFADIVDCFG